jgi:hypothetical protein
MRNQSQSGAGASAVAILCLGLGLGASVLSARETINLSARTEGHEQPQRELKKGGTVVSQQASGTFDVKVVPQGTPDRVEGSTLARMSIDKQYHGGLEATAKGEMLTAGTDVQGSAGYVAIERVTGTLDGRTGSFVLQHSGTLTRGAPALNITVVPDSGTGKLVGITGRLTVIIEGGKHSYEFEYTLPPTP